MKGPEAGILIAAEGVHVRFARGPVLAGVDLAVGRGEIVTIIGPNGAGKTTLLRVLLGLLAPSAGRLATAPGLRIGYMPQKIQVDPVLPLTVRRFLTLGGRRSRPDLASVLAEVGAEAVLESPVQTLSGGEMQRVLLARALLREPDLLVLDEPVQGVDVQGQLELFDLITRIRRDRGCAVLMVSHDLHLVMAATDRVVCLNRHVCCTGAPAAVAEDQAFRQMFGARALESLAIYPHRHRHDHRHPQAGEGGRDD